MFKRLFAIGMAAMTLVGSGVTCNSNDVQDYKRPMSIYEIAKTYNQIETGRDDFHKMRKCHESNLNDQEGISYILEYSNGEMSCGWVDKSWATHIIESQE